uniref:CopG family transcriptional regulator n=1 Tax=Haemonchus contortus TaxID=6289 RepID=A0A7I4YEU3_HAECO
MKPTSGNDVVRNLKKDTQLAIETGRSREFLLEKMDAYKHMQDLWHESTPA